MKSLKSNIMKSKGFGDTVAKFTKATGIKKFVDKVAKVTDSDCGCDQRQSVLNEWFPYKGSLRENEFKYLKTFFNEYNGNKLKSHKQRDELLKISNRVFQKKESPTSCSPCLKSMIKNLKIEFKKYENSGEDI